MGTKKAAVLPEPVWAQLMRSLLARMTGIEFFCTGVGVVYLARAMFASIMGVSSTSAKDSMPAGTSLPVASTGISSYLSKLIPPPATSPVPKSSTSTLSFRAVGFVQSSW